MHQAKVHPVKAACLACRSSKTRCDGQNPCSPCSDRGRSCVYRPSRRGGARYKRQNRESHDTELNHSTLSQLSPVSRTGSENPQLRGTSTFTNSTDKDPFNRGLQSINALLSPIPLQPDLAVTPNFLWDPHCLGSLSNSRGPLLRIYASEMEIINAYYVHLHHYLPLLPPPATPPEHDSQPSVFSPPVAEPLSVHQSSLPYWPTTSLGLALSAILALMPLPQDSTPSRESSIVLRRSFAQLYAQASLDLIEKEIDGLGQLDPRLGRVTKPESIHNDVPSQLRPVLALVVLSIYEYSQRGNIARMRARANQALTMAMDLSIHNLGPAAPESERRAWWSTVLMSYMSSIAQSTIPVIPTSDPRVTTPYPTSSTHTEESNPWWHLIQAVEAVSLVIQQEKKSDQESQATTQERHRHDKIRKLDSHILGVSAQTEQYMDKSLDANVEARAGLVLGVIANLLSHSARIRLHRVQAFSNVPLFVDKHCDIDGLMVNGEITLSPQSPTDSPTFPFTSQQSTIACLKSSLGISRALRHLCEGLSHPSIFNPTNQEDKPQLPRQPTPSSSTGSKEISGSLSYFRCAGMQACYSLFMVLHQVQAALTSGSLSSCYYLFGPSEPATELQDARRLMEEVRHGIECMRISLQADAGFEAIAAMSREVDTAYSCFFTI